MTATFFEKAVIVTRSTELDELVARFSTASQARFYLEHAGQDFAPIAAAHERYYEALAVLRRALPRGLKHQVIDRTLVPQFSFGDQDLIITIGQDGLVSNTAKYLAGQPLLAVNPDPARFDGILLPFTVADFGAALERTLTGAAIISAVTLARVELADGQSLLAFNDFFVGASSHVSARYTIEPPGTQELQSSSGIIISTGAGSTGWLQSVYAGAAGVISAVGGRVTPPENGGRLNWDDDYLIYSVREPFPSKITGTSIVYGAITRDAPLRITSHMARNGVIFSDGMESDFLSFNHGAAATITVAPQKARLIVKGG